MVPIPKQRPRPQPSSAQRPAQPPPTAQVTRQPPGATPTASAVEVDIYHEYFEDLREEPWDWITLSLESVEFQTEVLYFEDGKLENRRCKTDGLNWMFGRNGGVPLVRLHGVPQAIRFGTGTVVWFTAATPSTRSLLVKAPIEGGGSEIGPGRDATKPDGHLTWGNRTVADHSCWRLWNWINEDERKR